MGIPTLDSLKMVREASKDISVIASGGLKSGIDGAKAIRMGADIFGLAGPFLKAADVSENLVSEEIQLIIEQLKITMMCTGSHTINNLKKAELRMNHIPLY